KQDTRHRGSPFTGDAGATGEVVGGGAASAGFFSRAPAIAGLFFFLAAPASAWAAFLRLRAGSAGGPPMRGSRIVKVEPRPGRDHSRTSPPWRCTACLRS